MKPHTGLSKKEIGRFILFFISLMLRLSFLQYVTHNKALENRRVFPCAWGTRRYIFYCGSTVQESIFHNLKAIIQGILRCVVAVLPLIILAFTIKKKSWKAITQNSDHDEKATKQMFRLLLFSFIILVLWILNIT